MNLPKLSHQDIRDRYYWAIHTDITKAEKKDAKEASKNAYEDIPDELVEKFNFSELDLYKYEFKKYVIYCAIEALHQHVYTLDWFDGSWKTFSSDHLSDLRNVYKNNIIDTIAARKPIKKELQMCIVDLYKAFFPGRGKTIIFDRSFLNRVFIQKVFGFCSEDQAEEFYATLENLLKEIIYKENVKMEMFFAYISPETQNLRIWERAANPMQEHRVGEVDKNAAQMYHKQIPELRAVKEKIDGIEGLDFKIIDMENKEWWLIQIIKHILHDKDYPKKSKKLDFTVISSMSILWDDEAEQMKREWKTGKPFKWDK